MSDTDQDQVEVKDLDTLTDDEVMNLGPEEVQALMEQDNQEDVIEEKKDDDDEEEEIKNSSETENDNSSDNIDDDSGKTEDDNSSSETNDETDKDKEENEEKESNEDSSEETLSDDDFKAKPPADKLQEDSSKSSETENENKKEDSKTKDNDEVKKETSSVSNDVVEFHKKITAPFKADGKDIQIRSPEDAIKLMQMGVNYSRRMAEMKPLRALHTMLEENGLNDPAEISFLIDLKNGKPEAIQKLLKDKDIDPVDIDTTQDSTYKQSDYSVDPKDLDFKEAIDNTLSNPGGKEIIEDINKSWDDVSKEALRDQPAIFESLLAQQNSGVYKQITEELNYQRTMGHLTSVPFLQAYNQVGDAMQKAGVFEKSKVQSNGMGELKSKKSNPIDTGIRKAALKPKTEQPNPTLSSIPKSSGSNDTDSDKSNIDYSSMSDDDFLKLGSPA